MTTCKEGIAARADSRGPTGAGLSLQDLVARVDNLGTSGPGVEVLRRRTDATVLRLHTDDGTSVIAKMWSRTGMAGLVRRTTKTGPADREYRTLERLHRAGVSVPRPIGCSRLGGSHQPFTDVLFMEDLGRCTCAVDHLKAAVAAGGDAAGRFEEEIIGLTRDMLVAGVVDTDHGLVNTVATVDGRAFRLDFELARRVLNPDLFPAAYGEMLGRLIATYAFAVQPDVAMVYGFADRVRARLAPPRRVLRRASQFAGRMLERQRAQNGIDVRIEHLWCNE